MEAPEFVKYLAGRRVSGLKAEELTILWRYGLAGYLHTVQGIVYLTRG